MKIIVSTTLAFFIMFACVLALPKSSFAADDGSLSSYFIEFCRNNPTVPFCISYYESDECVKNPQAPECAPTVPEFGLIPGAVALLSSGGAFLFLKKRSS